MSETRSGDDELIGQLFWLLLGAAVLVAAWRAVGDRLQRLLPRQQPLKLSWLLVGLLSLLLSLAAVQWWRWVRRRRRRVLERLEAAIVGITGTLSGYRPLRVRGWHNSKPQRIVLRYPLRWTGEDVYARRSLQDVIERRMGAGYETIWRSESDVIEFLANGPLGKGGTKETRERVERIVRQAIPTALEVTATGWNDGEPTAISVVFGPHPRIASEAWRRLVERFITTHFVGRWRGEWDVRHDRVTFEPRPDMARFIRRPSALPPSKSTVISYATADSGEVQIWDLGSTQPHALVIGPTGGGKTTMIRAVVFDAVRQGVEVAICDPKRIEFPGLRGWPGVSAITVEAEDMAALVMAAKAEMDRRYLLPKQAMRASHPILLVLDEFYVLRHRLNAYWRSSVGDNGKPNKGEHPAIAAVSEMAHLARSARMHLVIGIQRPDAEFLAGAARDNFRHRVSLSTLSAEGARMMWGNSWDGIDLPNIAGRGIASGPMGPQEVQVWFTPDPGDGSELSGEDQRQLDDLRLSSVGPPEPALAAFDGRQVSSPIAASTTDASPAMSYPERIIDVREIGESEGEWEPVAIDQLVPGDRVRLDDGQEVSVVEADYDLNDEDSMEIEFCAVGDEGSWVTTMSSGELVLRWMGIGASEPEQK